MDQPLAFDRAFSSLGEERDLIAFDRATARTFDVDGRMRVDGCNLSKANVCPYFGREIPNAATLGLDANKIYYLYRDPEELRKGAETFRGLQLLLAHVPVNANDAKLDITVGAIGSDVEFVAPFLRGSLTVWTAEGIKLIETKEQAQLSCSYRYRADMVPGRSPEGVAFDGTMRDIMGNHVTLVKTGRAGSDVFVHDSTPLELVSMKNAKLVAAIVAALAASNVTLAADAQVALDKCIDADEALKDAAALDAAAAAKNTPIASDAQIALAIDSAIAAKGYVTKADADKLAVDAANAAVLRVDALHKAREDVKPLVGIVALDSAEAVYKFALEQSQVALDGVPAGAYGALVEQVKARKAAPTTTATPKIALDAATAARAAIPGLGRFQQA
jgi:uncharacterized protein